MGALEIRVTAVQLKQREKIKHRKILVKEKEIEELLTDMENLATSVYNITHKGKTGIGNDFCMQTHQIMLMLFISIRKYLGYDISKLVEKKMEESYHFCKNLRLN